MMATWEIKTRNTTLGCKRPKSLTMLLLSLVLGARKSQDDYQALTPLLSANNCSGSARPILGPASQVAVICPTETNRIYG